MKISWRLNHSYTGEGRYLRPKAYRHSASGVGPGLRRGGDWMGKSR